jgi:prevent-host-death family protein
VTTSTTGPGWPPGELTHHSSRVTARVRAGETVIVTEHGRPVIRMTPASGSTSVVDELIAAGRVHRTAHPGAVPELVDDLADFPSLSELLITGRDEERDR